MRRWPYNLFLLALLVCAHSASAQVKPPARDTLKNPADTTHAAPDTSQAAQAFADSVKPIPQLARFTRGPAHGFSDGVWEWDRAALLNEAATTLAELLQQIPGVIILRSGLFLQPTAASAMGGTANRLEVWLDGYVLDPLLEGSFDLTRLELAEIDNVRVERRMNTIRVYLETIGARDNRPYSMVEAAVGQPTASLFRGIFLAPKIIVGPAGVALDRIDTRGLRGAEPAEQIGGWAKWAFVRNGSGLQLEYRRATSRRDPQVPWPEHYARTDIVLRGRVQIRQGLVVEAFGGRSRAELDTATTSTTGPPKVNEEDTQLGGRIGVETRFFWANGSVRLRDAKALAASQIDAIAGVRFSVFSAAAQVAHADWRTAGSASELSLRADAGPFGPLHVFAEATSSERGAAYLDRLPDSTAIITPFTGYRAGAELAFRGITVGGALLHAESDSVTTFGLPFDTTRRTFPGSNATGLELSARVPLPLVNAFALRGSITDWRTGALGLYMPTRTYRAGLELHAIPLKSGNLEIVGRIERVYRGAMFALNQAALTPADALLTMPGIGYFDAYLQLRIIDVRAFVRYEDLQGQALAEVPSAPERLLRGPRVFYGVKWQFYN